MQIDSIIRVLILSYYHPWIAGGGHRPRRLMSEDLKKGRKVAFLYCDSHSEEKLFSRRQEEANPENLVLFRSLSTETLVCTTDTSNDILSIEQLLRNVDPQVVRVHNPSKIHQPIVTACRRLGICINYDIMDDWDGFNQQPWGVGTSSWYVDAADVVTAVSGHIVRKLKRNNVLVIPNAVPDAFLSAAQAMPKLAASAHARAIYLGALWPDWIDWSLIRRMVLELPEVDFTFIGALKGPEGECHDTGSEKIAAELTSGSTAVFLPEMDHRDMIPHMRAADFGLIPFVCNDVTFGASPLKVFDYLAVDLPVISTNLPEIAGYPGVVCARDNNDFIAQCAKAAQAKRFTHAELCAVREFLADATWTARSDQLDQLISAQIQNSISA